jgi:hypothetical protein
VRRKASQQAALEREKLRRLTGIGCVASSLIANWCADGWPGRRCDGSLATTGCGTRPWAAGSDDPKWPGNSSKPAAGRGLIRPLRPQDARRDSGSQAGEPNGRPSASELALHDRPRLATPAEPAPPASTTSFSVRSRPSDSYPCRLSARKRQASPAKVLAPDAVSVGTRVGGRAERGGTATPLRAGLLGGCRRGAGRVPEGVPGTGTFAQTL